MKLSISYNLKALYPELAKQWHPEKNGNLTPDQVTPGSQKRIWWRCEKGHEWSLTIKDKVNSRTSCPYCSRKLVSEEYNFLVLYPEAAKLWHPTKNGKLRPEQFTPGSQKKVWWRCEKGHEWSGDILSRTRQKNCPYCTKRVVSKEYNFLMVHPELAKQWHPLKNQHLRPTNVLPGSYKNVWWLCEKGHVWQSPIYQRVKYPGCPFCKHARPSRDYNLQVVKPELASQWHPAKNGRLKPTGVMPFSNKKVWWLCKEGHEWWEHIAVRSVGHGCPYCAGKRASKNHNFLAVHPELAKQWHPTKNGDLTPDQVTPGSKKKVWWRCEKGHEFEMRMLERRHGCGCPYCSGRRVSKEYNLLVIHPELAQQWHPTKNEKLAPDQFTPGTDKKVWWKCEKNHEWRASISKRTSGRGCPYCSRRKVSKENNLMVLHPEIANQWHPTKNGNLTPDKIAPTSGKQVWWKCKKGHEWMEKILLRTITKGTGCLYCRGRRVSKEYNFLTVHPTLASQWHPTKNGDFKPDQVNPMSLKKAWWQCRNGHEWRAAILDRSKSKGCPYCLGQRKNKKLHLSTLHPELAAQWHPTKNNSLTPDQVTPLSHRKVWWQCEKGHEWVAHIDGRIRGTGCPDCLRIRSAEGNNLKDVHPELAAQWHPTKNKNFTPDQVTPGSGKQVWWMCEFEHEWKAVISKRSQGQGCPYCSGRRRKYEYF